METQDVLCASVKALMSEKLPSDRIAELKAEGFKLKKPTRSAAIAVALYKKAENGDLTALKQIRELLSLSQNTDTDKTVVIVDDIGEKTE
ncbi:MAG: hypothetical protein IJJ40_04435 [Clostridia bacterium]|nr:hypothetical protein [Clostridia bacterium]